MWAERLYLAIPGYAWLLATPEGERYVEYHHSRAEVVANTLLGEDFTWVLVSDFYAGYNDTPEGRHQRCWVHLLRDAQTLREAHADDLTLTGLATRAWVDALLVGVWRRVRRTLTRPSASSAPPARRQALYQHPAPRSPGARRSVRPGAA